MDPDRDPVFEGPQIGLADILAAREARVRCRSDALKEYGRPTVSLSIVMPGAIKDCPLSRQVADAAHAALAECFRVQGWAVDMVLSETPPTGPEALFAVIAEAQALKRQMVDLEETHPLGRLWDLDVHSERGEALSRRAVGLPPRRCLICDQPAHACTRSRAHSLATLRAEMLRRLRAWHKATRVASSDDEGTS